MKLDQYLEREGITAAEFARRIERGRSAVTRWANGKRIPDPESMRRIAEATNHKVEPNDFYQEAAA